jgi:hypothetical protein
VERPTVSTQATSEVIRELGVPNHMVKGIFEPPLNASRYSTLLLLALSVIRNRVRSPQKFGIIRSFRGGCTMKTLGFLGLLCGFVALSLPSASAQNSNQVGRSEGATMPRLVSIFIPPLLNAPFTAIVTTVWTIRFGDGNSRTIKNHRTIARDSAGRIFQERRYFTPDGDKEETAITQIEYSDPTTHQIYICHPDGHVCELYEYRMLAVADDATNETSSSAVNNVKSEDLGHEEILGLDAIGTRETTTIAPGTVGNDQPLAAVRELWHSTQLGFNLVLDKTDPTSGNAQIRVTDIHLGEPDARLLAPPESFSVVDARRSVTPSAK